MERRDGYPYQFDPGACQSCSGICCRGSTGHVWITGKEIENLADAKKMDLDHFTRLYVRAARGRLALQERVVQGEYLCCFFDPVEVCCTVYAVRPEQCRTYPFWEPFRKNAAKLQFECPGVRLLARPKQ